MTLRTGFKPPLCAPGHGLGGLGINIVLAGRQGTTGTGASPIYATPWLSPVFSGSGYQTYSSVLQITPEEGLLQVISLSVGIHCTNVVTVHANM